MKLSPANGFIVFPDSRSRLFGLLRTCTYLYVILLLICSGFVDTCVFPDYVQTDVNGSRDARDWKGQIKNQNREVKLTYQFHSDVMRVTSADLNIRPYSRLCIQAYGNDTFLVAHEEIGQTTGRFTCVQILRKTSTILQIRQAEIAETLTVDLCSDSSLILDGWLIIDTKNVMNQREDCSLKGGFNMQVYDKAIFMNVCDGYLGETRLESECIQGEGLSFYFRQGACVPDGLYMYPTQRTYCLGNWEDGGFHFSLLKHDNMNLLWVLRYPKLSMENKNEFTALLMKDLFVATINSDITTNNYLSLTMTRQSPKTLDHLCFDDYEICSVLSDPCSYSEDIARTCAKTCGFCSDVKPQVSQFRPSIAGSWKDVNGPEQRSSYVHINQTSIHVADNEILHCIDWTGQNSSNSSNSLQAHHLNEPASWTKEQMVVTVSDNGCRPRFSCTKLIKMEHFLFMHFSQTRLWPLVEKKDDPYNCSNFVYSKNADIDQNPYRKRQTSMFIQNQYSGTVSCDLSNFTEIDVRFKDGTQCSANLVQTSFKDSIEFVFPADCEVKVKVLNNKFNCIEFSNFPPQEESDMLLITDTNDRSSTTDIHCWLFPVNPSNIFYMINSGDCNNAMERKIKKGRLQPIATFRTRDSWSEGNTIGANGTKPGFIDANDTLFWNTTSPPKSSDSSDSQDGTTINQSIDNITRESKDGEPETPSGAVVVGIVLSLIAFKVSIICGCSC